MDIHASHYDDELDRIKSLTWRDGDNNILRSFVYERDAVGYVTRTEREDGSHEVHD